MTDEKRARIQSKIDRIDEKLQDDSDTTPNTPTFYVRESSTKCGKERSATWWVETSRGWFCIKDKWMHPPKFVWTPADGPVENEDTSEWEEVSNKHKVDDVIRGMIWGYQHRRREETR